MSRSSSPGRPSIARGVVRVEASLAIRAPRARVLALYLDHAHWARLFPATIRGVRLLRQAPGEIVVEVEHRGEGPVVNVIRPRSPHVVELEEFKRRFDATFVNRFDDAPEGTRYTVVAEVRLKPPLGPLAPFLRALVRRRVRRYVLEPMRAFAEAELGNASPAASPFPSFPMTRERVPPASGAGRASRLLAACLGLALAANGAHMMLAPEHWFALVPGAPAPFNAHLVRDVGIAYLVAGGGIAALGWSARARPAAVAGAAFLALHGLLHLVEAVSRGHAVGELGRDFLPVLAPALLALWLARAGRGDAERRAAASGDGR